MRGKMLITRPIEQANAFRDVLIDRFPMVTKRDFLMAPMLDIELYNLDVDAPKNCAAIIVTSRHAAQFVPHHVPTFVVGESVARLLRARDIDVLICAKNVDDLVQKIVSYSQKGAHFLYLRGVDVRADLKVILEEDGFSLEEKIVYKAHAPTDFPHDVTTAIKSGHIGAVSFFSARSAQAFSACVDRYGLYDLNTNCRALCISDAVAACVSHVFKRNIDVARTPDMDGMISLCGDVWVNCGK